METINSNVTWMTEWLHSRLELLNLSEFWTEVLLFGVSAVIMLLLSWLSFVVVRRVLIFSIIKMVRKTKSKIDDYLVHRKVFHRLAHLAPVIVIYFLSDLFWGAQTARLAVFHDIVSLYLLVVIIMAFQALLKAFEDIYNTFPFAYDRPIKGYLQVIQLLAIIVGVLIAVSIVFNVEVTAIIAGMGALAAVLMLVFRDSILGLVAGVQLSANRMVRVGDWISMPGHNADGTVLEITLNTVKVRNWDKTISTIPTYAMVSNSFVNWRGMEESGGRRIARSVFIDTHSVKFCTPEMLEKFKKIHHLKAYIEERQIEIENYNRQHEIDESLPVNGRRMTNLGIFRKYLENYLIKHPKINDKMTLIVRHLDPTEKGIPMQIYAFSREQEWAKYEAVQADIFDHVLAIIPLFELRIFQNPSGDDLKMLGSLVKN
ncbi:mechanosensitive ion channel family protein [Marinilabilia salmonicolor]|uniref:Miniconductance mechanosensitive channel n=1 Tax=Marinilabilia salmonicolor TaxID=989 RepID=A0A2T0XN90_9BACT|nr:mechanosensitive ion channel domain-containing protein [Marinilabilia salmonicolor]PRZ00377.1 miniconductance mechanosensitive channel [Marinilabilia salmonicolor]RCW34554.1 miniconductance mechanosensitive channel [Marinilabilia salmonicolor]